MDSFTPGMQLWRFIKSSSPVHQWYLQNQLTQYFVLYVGHTDLPQHSSRMAVQRIIWNETSRFLYFSLSPSYASWEWKLRWKQPYQSIVHNTGLHTRSPICLQVTSTEGWIESDRNKAVNPGLVTMIKHNIYPCFNCQAGRQEAIVTCVMSSQGCSWIKGFSQAIKTSLKIDIIGTLIRLSQFIWDMLHKSLHFHFLLECCLPKTCSQAWVPAC